MSSWRAASKARSDGGWYAYPPETALPIRFETRKAAVAHCDNMNRAERARDAAGDLLAVVEMVVTMLDCSRAPPTVDDMAKLESMAKAAIAKATGAADV